MKLMRSLLAAAALALPLSAFHVSVTDVAAQAQAAKPAKKVVKAKSAKKVVKAKPAKKVVKAKVVKKAKKSAGKSCGEYKYLKGGKCLDARAKAAKG